MNALILILTLIAMPAIANEADCLSRIMFAESKGESVEGAIAIGDAAKLRAIKTANPICKIKGVKKHVIPVPLRPHYKALARSVLASKQSTVGNADSWNVGNKPANPGKITRHIENHVFYVMANLKR